MRPHGSRWALLSPLVSSQGTREASEGADRENRCVWKPRDTRWPATARGWRRAGAKSPGRQRGPALGLRRRRPLLTPGPLSCVQWGPTMNTDTLGRGLPDPSSSQPRPDSHRLGASSEPPRGFRRPVQRGRPGPWQPVLGPSSWTSSARPALGTLAAACRGSTVRRGPPAQAADWRRPRPVGNRAARQEARPGQRVEPVCTRSQSPAPAPPPRPRLRRQALDSRGSTGPWGHRGRGPLLEGTCLCVRVHRLRGSRTISSERGRRKT